MSLYEFDRAIVRARGYKILAGADEAGRGPLAGPVVAAAVVLSLNKEIEGVNDSKKLSSKERERLYDLIIEGSLSVGVGIVDSEKIDKINILNATKLAMNLAINDLKTEVDIILIDGLRLPSLKVEQMMIEKGDQKSASIAAASIIAKVTRDRIMDEYHRLYPWYGFNKNKGYATQEHIKNLNLYGCCPIHRRSFCKVSHLSLFD
ncbi:MAG: ribonuclease HII [Thermodesulfovibrionales bacterium]|nr:ribonuclease HII [Thermodesulfovibrionales bacterium]